MELNVFKMEQKPRFPMFLTVMSARDLLDRANVDCWTDFTEGYQRTLNGSRFTWTKNSLLKFMIKGMGVFPTPIVVNLRKPVTFVLDSTFDYFEIGKINIGDQEMWIVDGQHRLHCLSELIEKDNIYMNHPLMVTILNTENIYDEMCLFYYIHDKQERITNSMKSKILNKILWKKGQKEIILMDGMSEAKRALAYDITRDINNRKESPFYNRIKFYDSDDDGFILDDAQMVSTILPLINCSIYKGNPISNITEDLIEYWNGILQIYPEMFVEPKDYIPLSKNGMLLFNKMLICIYSHINRGGITETNVEEFLNVLFDEAPAHTIPEFRSVIDSTFWHKRLGPKIIREMSYSDINQIMRHLLEKIYINHKITPPIMNAF